MNLQSHHKFFILALVAIIALVVLSYFFFIAFSGFLVALGKGVLGLLLLWLFDRFVLHGIDLLTELKNGNIAYAIALFAYSIIVAAAITAS